MKKLLTTLAVVAAVVAAGLGARALLSRNSELEAE